MREDRRAAGVRVRSGRQGTVVRSVSAAASRQARFSVGREHRHKRPQPEKQNQENANHSPHMELMVTENLFECAGAEEPLPVVRYHRGIA
jgi:hypothetical protein